MMSKKKKPITVPSSTSKPPVGTPNNNVNNTITKDNNFTPETGARESPKASPLLSNEALIAKAATTTPPPAKASTATSQEREEDTHGGKEEEEESPDEDYRPDNFAEGLTHYLATTEGRRKMADFFREHGFLPPPPPTPVTTLPQNNPPTPKQIKFPRPSVKFNGTSGTLDKWADAWRVWFLHDNLTCERSKIGVAAQSLNGAAQDWYNQLVAKQTKIPFETFDALVSELHASFEPRVNASYWWREFFGVAFHSSVTEFIRDFRIARGRVDPPLPEVFAIEYFKYRLPAAFRVALEGEQPEDLKEHFDVATQLEITHPHLLRSHQQNNNRNNDRRAVKHAVSGISLSASSSSSRTPSPINSGSSSSSNSSPNNSPPKKKVRVPTRPCKHCGQEGHMDWDCPTNSSKNNNSNNSNNNNKAKGTVTLSGNALGGTAPGKG